MKCLRLGLLCLLFVSFLPLTFSQDVKAPPPKPKVESPIPEIPLAYQTKFQALLIQQDRETATRTQAIYDFDKANSKLTAIKAEGDALQSEMFSALHIDPKTYTTTLDEQGVVHISKR